LRPGQQELMELRRQWHAQRAARETAREQAVAAGLIESLGENHQNPEFDQALQWEIEQETPGPPTLTRPINAPW
jgi:hypothetical protein